MFKALNDERVLIHSLFFLLFLFFLSRRVNANIIGDSEDDGVHYCSNNGVSKQAIQLFTYPTTA